MTGLLLATGIASGLTTALFPPQYLATITVYQGDPLGSVRDPVLGAGKVEVLCRPQLLLTAGQAGYFQVGQDLPPKSSLSIRLTCTHDSDSAVRTAFESQIVNYAPPPPGVAGIGPFMTGARKSEPVDCPCWHAGDLPAVSRHSGVPDLGRCDRSQV